MWFFKVYVHGFFLGGGEKPYFKGRETLKKGYCAFIYFWIFPGSPILPKDETFFSRVM